MAIHFEELWEKCESLHKEAVASVDMDTIVNEMVIKLNLYKALSAKEGIPESELQKIRSRVLGEVLLTMTCLSVKNNVDVFEALSMALQYRSVEQSQKH